MIFCLKLSAVAGIVVAVVVGIPTNIRIISTVVTLVIVVGFIVMTKICLLFLTVVIDCTSPLELLFLYLLPKLLLSPLFPMFSPFLCTWRQC